MVLSTSVASASLATLPSNLADALEDMAASVMIQSDLCIKHPQYQPFQVPPEIVNRFEHVPADLKQKYLMLQLRSFLYGIYYNGSLQTELALDSDSEKQTQFQDLENNTYFGLDLDFLTQLHQHNTGTGYFDPGWQVVEQVSEENLTVKKGGLTLYINCQRHLVPEVTAAVGEVVAIRLPSNLMQNGFYVAVGNAGKSSERVEQGQEPIVRLYFNVTSQGAVTVMKTLTQQMNAQALPFTFKVLYNPANYQRHDAGVLYVERSHYLQVRGLLQSVYAKHQSHFGQQEPLFTKRLAPGLGLAEEPDRKFGQSESFGQNRCQIVANALLEAETFSDKPDYPEQRLATIQRHFQQIGLDLTRPYLNANAEDIYAPLDL
ncbi:hypothetical protein D0962_31810 [Leptolyngbyaceae cyanobacterium CCMR0082]|uniref:Uncharacterized protein n=1 Tax=Adonisia turfae CCMR0082 TaxID=2304604 RepID=A0A6M0SH65_9CYAN|nr:T3SS effector HopA1 family protein [Adonisia turfae]MDV3348622.1 T3SS effector HopA1 family protein [Leptothoe sp. LEGE 181152]NEZ67291.1 hypothetical protein [Adonisia turfae CCMR0082]